MPTIPERIHQFNSDRLPEFTALKYQLMAENPFRFLRGSCHIFYEDLAGGVNPAPLPGSPLSWVCGDLHLENFGTYKGDNRLVYFDLNDFDEGALAPVSWELTRMLTSIYAGLGSLGIKKKEATGIATLFVKTYSTRLALGKARYIERQTARGIVRSFLDKVGERKQKELIRQRTFEKNGSLRIRVDHVRFFPLEKALRRELSAHLTQWIHKEPSLDGRNRVLDAAFRVAGTGSLGIPRYVFLLRNNKDPKKHLLIDMKQSRPSCLEPWLPHPRPSWVSEADRIVHIQGRMQNIPPALLSTTSFRGEPYVLKELQPTADKIDFLLMKDRYEDIACVIEDMALLMASSQLRSAGRQGSAIADELIAFGNEKSWQQELLNYALAYSGQVKKDYEAYFTAFKAGYF